MPVTRRSVVDVKPSVLVADDGAAGYAVEQDDALPMCAKIETEAAAAATIDTPVADDDACKAALEEKFEEIRGDAVKRAIDFKRELADARANLKCRTFPPIDDLVQQLDTLLNKFRKPIPGEGHVKFHNLEVIVAHLGSISDEMKLLPERVKKYADNSTAASSLRTRSSTPVRSIQGPVGKHRRRE